MALGPYALHYCHEDRVSGVASCAAAVSHLGRPQGTSSDYGACTESFGDQIESHL